MQEDEAEEVKSKSRLTVWGRLSSEALKGRQAMSEEVTRRGRGGGDGGADEENGRRKLGDEEEIGWLQQEIEGWD